MANFRVPVPAEASQTFTEIAQGTRLTWHMLNSGGAAPLPRTNFKRVNDLYPFEKVSDRARHYVAAALEHLVLWADFAAPLKFHPEQTTEFSLRPTMALARAALESAAQAVWLMDTKDPNECVRRHLCLIRWDIAEHRKSRLDLEEKQRISARDEELVERVAQFFSAEEIRPPTGYLWVIQQACRPDDLDLEASQVEQHWREMSGAAHGMYWTNLELTKVGAGEEYEPGHFRSAIVPDPVALTEAMQVAYRMTQYGTLKFLDFSGADITALYPPALAWLAENITLRPDADPDARTRLADLAFPHPDPGGSPES